MEYDVRVVLGRDDSGRPTQTSFYECQCGTLVAHSEDATVKHTRWHEDIRQQIALANLGFGGFGFLR